MSHRQVRQLATVGADWQNCLCGMLGTIFCTRLAHQYRRHWVKGKNLSPSSLQNRPASIINWWSGRRASHRPLCNETGPLVLALLGDRGRRTCHPPLHYKTGQPVSSLGEGKKTQSSSLLYTTGLPVSSLLGEGESSLQNWLASIVIGWRGWRASPSSGP